MCFMIGVELFLQTFLKTKNNNKKGTMAEHVFSIRQCPSKKSYFYFIRFPPQVSGEMFETAKNLKCEDAINSSFKRHSENVMKILLTEQNIGFKDETAKVIPFPLWFSFENITKINCRRGP